MDVAIATCLHLPEPDPDEELLAAALAAQGLEAHTLSWDDPQAAFHEARVTVIRSTWNYTKRRDDFVAWADRTSRVTRLWNPAEVVRWNSHKAYLVELERRGLPVVPTRLVPCGADTPLVAAAAGWPLVVVKPAVSAGSFGTRKVAAASPEGEAHLRRLAAERDVLVQPFLESVEGHGERALIWIDGALTHAVRKSPRFEGDAESVSAAVPIAADEAALAEEVLASVSWPLLYGRVDVARAPDGQLLLMELEVLEPSLYLAQSPAALARFVRAIARIS